MNPKSKKKIEDFKKEIKKEAFERKKGSNQKGTAILSRDFQLN